MANDGADTELGAWSARRVESGGESRNGDQPPDRQQQEPRRRSFLPALIAGLILPFLLVGTGVIGYLISQNANQTDGEAADSAESTEPEGPAADDDGATTETSEAEEGAETTVAETTVTEVAETTAVTEVDTTSTTLTSEQIQAHLDETAGGDPSPRALVTVTPAGLQVRFVGAIPDGQIGLALEADAGEDAGPENVTNDFVVDTSSTWTIEQGLPVFFDQTVLFDVDSSEVRMEDFGPIMAVGQALLERVPTASITVITHTDATGDEAYNLQLSEDRANAIVEVWVAAGVNRDQLAADPRGERDASQSDDPATRAQERRAEFLLEGVLG